MLGEVFAAVIVVGVIPWLSSGAVAALRALATRRADLGLQSTRTEAMVLVLMLLPVLIGTTLLALGAILPRPPQLLLDRSVFVSITSLATELAAVAAAPKSSSWQLLALAAVTIYLVGLGVATTRLLLAGARLRRIATSSIACPALGPDVRVSTDADFSFAGSRGIVLPHRLVNSLSARDLLLVIRHERAHIERGDPRTYWLLACIDSLFWLNPMVRRQTMRCRLAAELACDATVVAYAPEARAAYAAALVAALRDAGYAPGCTPGMSSTRNKGEHRVRITRILDPTPMRPSRFGRLMIAATTLLVVPVTALQFSASAANAHDVITFQLPRNPPGGPAPPMVRAATPRKTPNNAASQAAVLRMSDEFQRGKPPVLASVMREVFAKLGPIESITFLGIYPSGADVFEVRHANGIVRWDVKLAPDGTASSVHLLRKLDSGGTMFWGTVSS